MSNRFLGIASYLALPYLAAKACFDPSFRSSVPERRGFGAWEGIRLSGTNTVWLHGASVGEVSGVVPVLNALKKERPDLQMVVTTTSLTGKEELQRRDPQLQTALFPLDYPRAVCRTLDRVRPALMIIFETELWPNFLLELQRRKIPVLLVNGRISDYSYPKYSKVRSLVRPLLEVFSKLLVQTHLDRERFIALGAPRENVLVTGSTKYAGSSAAAIAEEERSLLRAVFGIEPDVPCFVAGSVRPGEEEIVVAACRSLRRRYPNLQCVLAPRHLDRVENICSLLKVAGLSHRCRSEMAGSEESRSEHAVVVLDTHGELRKAYSFATVSFVGGSLVDIGGHNPLEPAAFGVPVLFGPYDRNVRDAIWQLTKAGGATIVHDEADLIAAVSRLIDEEDLRNQQGEAARRVAEQNARALEQVLPVLRRHLPAAESRVVVNFSK